MGLLKETITEIVHRVRRQLLIIVDSDSGLVFALVTRVTPMTRHRNKEEEVRIDKSTEHVMRAEAMCVSMSPSFMLFILYAFII